MRAVRFLGSDGGVVLDASYGEPSCAAGEAVVRPVRCAVADADLDVVRGLQGAPPITLGHEFVGVIEQLEGDGGGRLRRGARVVGQVSSSCGGCDMCRAGLSNHCRDATLLGIRGRDGCFADAFALPMVNLHAVPDGIDDERAVFAEPLASALHAAQQIRLEGKPYVTVLGDNATALLCAQVMTRLNASVRVVGWDEARMAVCDKWRIRHRPAEDVGRRADQDVVVDCTGTGAGFRTACAMVRPRGVIVLKHAIDAGAPGAPEADLGPVAAKELQVVGSRCGSIPEALAALEREEFDVLELIDGRSKLDHAVEALRHAASPGALKVLLAV